MHKAKQVLVIDDDGDFRESIRPLLENRGYLVIEASSGKEGLRKLIEFKPDVIVLDIMMECLEEGYGVNQAIKFKEAFAEYRSIPIIMVSSIHETPRERYPRAGEVDMIEPDCYLTKPLDLPRFLEVLDRLSKARA
ncbi:MAG: response regulator [Candidatus Krumholzibacteria bacterium]|nr:response regulator [Candidatus Krumholzibacteria bacterium]